VTRRAPEPDALERVSADGKATALSGSTQLLPPPPQLVCAVPFGIDPDSGAQVVSLQYLLPPTGGLITPAVGGAVKLDPYIEQLMMRLTVAAPMLARADVLEIRRDDDEETAREHAANVAMIVTAAMMELADILEAAPHTMPEPIGAAVRRVKDDLVRADGRMQKVLELLAPAPAPKVAGTFAVPRPGGPRS